MSLSKSLSNLRSLLLRPSGNSARFAIDDQRAPKVCGPSAEVAGPLQISANYSNEYGSLTVQPPLANLAVDLQGIGGLPFFPDEPIVLTPHGDTLTGKYGDGYVHGTLTLRGDKAILEHYDFARNQTDTFVLSPD